MSFYLLSNIADFNRAAKGLSGGPAVYNQSTRVNFGGFMLLCHNIQFVPPKNKKSFPFLESFLFVRAGISGGKSRLIYDEIHRSGLAKKTQ
jgi:hypothetical protein